MHACTKVWLRIILNLARARRMNEPDRCQLRKKVRERDTGNITRVFSGPDVTLIIYTSFAQRVLSIIWNAINHHFAHL